MIGKILTLTINDTGMHGEGIAKRNDFTVFVSGVLVGEVVNAKVVSQKKNLLFAKVIKVVTPSEFRVTPPCNKYFACGGCSLQHIAYDKQLQLKQQALKNTLKKQLTVPFEVSDVVPCEMPLGYRNKAQLPVGEENGKVVVGFFKPNTHTIVPLTECPLHGEWLTKVMQAFLTYANENNISVYKEHTRTGLLRHLVVRHLSGVLTITVVGNGTQLPKQDSFITELNKVLKGFSWSLYFSPNTTHSNVIMGNSVQLLHGQNELFVRKMGLTVSVHPFSFFQVNDFISEQIYNKVANLVAGKNHVVMDAYSGAGLLTTLIAQKVKKAVGIEIVKEAVDDAKKLAQLNKIDNVEHLCADVKTGFAQAKKLLGKQDELLVVLDPPRKGCEPQVLEEILKAKPSMVVYVSCNPATLARDLKELTKAYQIALVEPYDMFPHTNHVETLVVLKQN